MLHSSNFNEIHRRIVCTISKCKVIVLNFCSSICWIAYFSAIALYTSDIDRDLTFEIDAAYKALLGLPKLKCQNWHYKGTCLSFSVICYHQKRFIKRNWNTFSNQIETELLGYNLETNKMIVTIFFTQNLLYLDYDKTVRKSFKNPPTRIFNLIFIIQQYLVSSERTFILMKIVKE